MTAERLTEFGALKTQAPSAPKLMRGAFLFVEGFRRPQRRLGMVPVRLRAVLESRR
jgi:hypothetical protein